MQLETTFQKRLVAYKVNINSILSSSFVKDELSAGYIKMNNTNVSRVNIIATVVYKSDGQSYANAIVDDSTGKISLRSFEGFDFFSKIDVGDVVLIIGKVREFNNEKYVIPEILKKVENKEWINIRKMELREKEVFDDKVNVKNEVLAQNAGINEEIFLLIKKLDNGDGVSIESVMNNLNDAEAETAIKSMLERGDVFEIRPGMVKLLE